MEEKIIEILQNRNNMFDFEIIGLLISFYGYSEKSKEFFRHPTSNILHFDMIFREKLKNNRIKISYEKYFADNYYQYFHRFALNKI